MKLIPAAVLFIRVKSENVQDKIIPSCTSGAFGDNHTMKIKFTYWQEQDGKFLGYLNDYPDHWTQGDSLEDLKEHLKDLYDIFSSESVPGIRKIGELEVA